MYEDVLFFPTEWDKTNPYAIRLFNTCKIYYKKGEEKKLYEAFRPHIVFIVFCSSVICYTLAMLIAIIVKRDVYIKSKSNITLSVLFSIGTLISVSSLSLRRLDFYSYPCFVLPYLNCIGFSLNIFSCSGNVMIYLKQCYNNAELYEKHQTVESQQKKIKKRNNIMYKICIWFTEKRLVNVMLIYTTISLFYLIFLSLFERNYTYHPISRGYCQTNMEQLSESILILVFMYIFTPAALIEISKFRGSFSFGRTLSISLTLLFILINIYLITNSIGKYWCTPIIRYLPPEFYLIMMLWIFTVSQITVPFIEGYRVSRKVNDLEITKKGLLKVFDNEILYKEFFEFAVKKRSVEYAIFHIEYLEFKAIFKNNKDFLDELSQSKVLAPGPDPVTTKDKKLVQVFEEIYRKADDIFSKYFNEESELELNLPAKVVKKVTNRLYDYNIYYNRFIVNGTEGREININQLNCEDLFDEVHEEALDSLFLNVYSIYAKDKKKSYGFDINNNNNNKISRTTNASLSLLSSTSPTSEGRPSISSIASGITPTSVAFSVSPSSPSPLLNS